MENQKVELPLDLVNAIIGYLVKRPFEDVAGLVQAIYQNVQGDKARDVPPPPPAN